MGKLDKMNKKESIKYFRAKGLLPFQAEFALNFIEQKGKRYWQLISPVGTGKTRIGVSLVAYELEEESNKRILVLAPNSLLMQWHSELYKDVLIASLQNPPLIIDRKTYLELESRTPVGKSPWPLPAIILMSFDLAKRDDMTENLCSVIWDLVIFDESHQLVGKRKYLFNRLKDRRAMRRALLLSATEGQPFGDIITKLTLRDVVDWDGKALYPVFEKKLEPIYYERTKKEKAFLNELEQFANRLSALSPVGKFQGTNILRVASSSIFAIEQTLHRFIDSWKIIRNKMAHNIPLTKEDTEKIQQYFINITDETEEIEEIPDVISIPSQELLSLFQETESLLSQIEEIPDDSKLNALISYVQEVFKVKSKGYLCIWSTYANTINYLSINLQDFEKPVYSLTGSLDPDTRCNMINRFQETGGILITSDVASEGVTLHYVDECINYDLSLTPDRFEQRWGRFLRVGRKTEFKMVILRDLSKSFTWEEDLLKRIETSLLSE